MAPPMIRVAFFLDHFKVSMAKDTGTSRRAMALVTAAKNTRIKNRQAKMPPPAMAANTFGRVPKMSPGPWPGSSPKANTAGKMAIPARTAMMVSSPATDTQLLGIFSFSLK